MKLVIFSDIHYAPEKDTNDGPKAGRKLIQYSIPIVKKLINEINDSIHPDVAINLGDLIEDCKDHDEDIINLSFMWDILKEIRAPFYSTIGNHDLFSMQSEKEVEKVMGYEDSTFSVDSNGYHLIFLGLIVNTQVDPGYGGTSKTRSMSNEDIEWLKKDLEQNHLPCIVFTHYGIAEDDMKGNYWFEECPNSALLENRKEVKDILKSDNNLIAVFSGHQHWTKKIIEDGVSYYVIGSLTENINDEGVPDGVYFEVDIEQDKLKVNEHHIRL